eukprot:maker-scaffold_7-snap-gene-7.37-mRNA-1 protein AED:0.03 eAED:0.03 QI:134/1/1/1/1/1/2/383/216
MKFKHFLFLPLFTVIFLSGMLQPVDGNLSKFKNQLGQMAKNALSNIAPKGFTPYLKALPKILPLLTAKVPSEKCKVQGKELGKVIARKNSGEVNLGNLQETLCVLEEECFVEYAEATLPLAENKLVKTLLKSVDLKKLVPLAGKTHQSICRKKNLNKAEPVEKPKPRIEEDVQKEQDASGGDTNLKAGVETEVDATVPVSIDPVENKDVVDEKVEL